MTLKDDYPFDLAVDSVRTLKAQIVEEGGGGPHDIDPMLTFHRKGGVVAFVQVGHTSSDMRNDALGAARVGILGWGADRVTLSLEGYHRTQVVESTADLPNLERGELGEHFRENADSDVMECLVVNEIKEYGDDSHALMPYHYGDGGALVWGETIRGDETDGAVPDALRAFLAERSAVDEAFQQMGLPEDWQFHRDRATGQALTELGHQVLQLVKGECTCG
jgi:hypothetical protein